MKKPLLLILLLFFVSLQAQEFTQVDSQTKIVFKIKNFGVNVDGDFSEIKIETNFDSNQLEQSYLKATIAVKSIATGIESRDKHILEEDYFDESNHPNITLSSTQFQKNANGTILMTANVTMKGITKRVEIPLIVRESEEKLTIQSNFEINRKEFNIGGGSFVMGKLVRIQVVYSGIQ